MPPKYHYVPQQLPTRRQLSFLHNSGVSNMAESTTPGYAHLEKEYNEAFANEMVPMGMIDHLLSKAQNRCYIAVTEDNFKDGAFADRITKDDPVSDMLKVFTTSTTVLTPDEIRTLRTVKFFVDTIFKAGDKELNYRALRNMNGRIWEMEGVFEADRKRIESLVAVPMPTALETVVEDKESALPTDLATLALVSAPPEANMSTEKKECEDSEPISATEGRERQESLVLRGGDAATTSHATTPSIPSVRRNSGRSLSIRRLFSAGGAGAKGKTAAEIENVKNSDVPEVFTTNDALTEQIDDALKTWETAAKDPELESVLRSFPSPPTEEPQRKASSSSHAEELKALGSMGKVSGLKNKFKLKK